MTTKCGVFCLAVLFLLVSTVDGFVPLHHHLSRRCHAALHLGAAKKGFGNAPTQPPKPQKKKNSQSPPTSSSSITADEEDTTATAADFKPIPSTAPPPDLTQGKIALEKMRREKAEQRNQELQKIREVQNIDQMVRESPEAAVIPEKVAQRMGRRMLPFVGIPLFGSMASFVGFWYMATYRDMEFQPVLVATTSLVLLAIGIVVSFETAIGFWTNDCVAAASRAIRAARSFNISHSQNPCVYSRYYHL
jgi:Photosynthesis affected mutant 68